MNEYQSLWNKILINLQEEFDNDTYNEIFKDCQEVFKYENSYIYIVVPNPLIKFRIEQFYIKRIKEIGNTLNSNPIGFKFITQKDKLEEIEKKKETTAKISEIDSRNLGRNLSSLYRFDNFVVGESNRYAFLTAMKVAENRVIVCNPLYIFGDVGLGKTHLMTSIGNYVLDNDITANIVYTSSQKFAEDYFLATSKNGRDKIEAFYNKYNSADVLLVDDIQFLEGKQATQEEFFKIFEHLITSNKQIVITSDRPAASLKNVMSRLKSRFSWGIAVDIKKPDKELLINVLKNKLSFLIEEPQDVNDEVLSILADCFPSNIRDLEGALRTYINYCICMNCSFTKDNLYIALEKIIPKNIDELDSNKTIIEKSKSIICSYFNISQTDLSSSSRKQQIAYARQMLMFILRTNFNIPLQTIGDNLGSRDHATIAHGIDKITVLLKSNQLVKNDVEMILKKIENS